MSDSSVAQPKYPFTKRYWLFMFQDYDQHGGLSDLVNSYDTIEEAKAAMIFDRNHDGHIFDSQELRVIAVIGYEVDEDGYEISNINAKDGEDMRRWITPGNRAWNEWEWNNEIENNA